MELFTILIILFQPQAWILKKWQGLKGEINLFPFRISKKSSIEANRNENACLQRLKTGINVFKRDLFYDKLPFH